MHHGEAPRAVIGDGAPNYRGGTQLTLLSRFCQTAMTLGATEGLGRRREPAMGNREGRPSSPSRELPPWMNGARPALGEAVGGSSDYMAWANTESQRTQPILAVTCSWVGEEREECIVHILYRREGRSVAPG